MKIKYFSLLLILGILLTACGNGTKELTSSEVVTAFQDAGLQAEESREMTKDDYGMAPMKAEKGTIVKIGDDMNARIMSFKNESDLEETKEYYDKLGEESAMLFSWTLAKDNILIQMNGDLPEDKYNEYKEVLEEL